MKKNPKIISGLYWSKEFTEFWDSEDEDVLLFKRRYKAVLKELKNMTIEKRRLERIGRQVEEQKKQIEKAKIKKEKNEKRILQLKEKAKILEKRGKFLKGVKQTKKTKKLKKAQEEAAESLKKMEEEIMKEEEVEINF